MALMLALILFGSNSSSMFGPYAGPLGPKPTEVNIVGNVWKRGPSSSATYLDAVWLHPNTLVFPEDNRGTKCPTGCADEWDLGFREEFSGFDPADQSYRSAIEFEVPAPTQIVVRGASVGVPTLMAAKAFLTPMTSLEPSP